MTHKANPATYDILAEYYDQMFTAWGKNYEAESNKLRELIYTYKLSSGVKLLDIACGTGEHIKHLKNDFSIVGVDISDKMLAVCRQKNPTVTLIQSSFNEFVVDGTFDVIICLFSAISYTKTIDNLRYVLGKCANYLVEGGIIIFEPWFAPEQEEEFKDAAHFGQLDELKACRMRSTIVTNQVAQIESHVLISDKNKIHHMVMHHELGLFTDADLEINLQACGFEVFIEHQRLGVSRLFIGRKPYKPSPNATSF